MSALGLCQRPTPHGICQGALHVSGSVVRCERCGQPTEHPKVKAAEKPNPLDIVLSPMDYPQGWPDRVLILEREVAGLVAAVGELRAQLSDLAGEGSLRRRR